MNYKLIDNIYFAKKNQPCYPDVYKIVGVWLGSVMCHTSLGVTGATFGCRVEDEIKFNLKKDIDK